MAQIVQVLFSRAGDQVQQLVELRADPRPAGMGRLAHAAHEADRSRHLFLSLFANECSERSSGKQTGSAKVSALSSADWNAWATSPSCFRRPAAATPRPATKSSGCCTTPCATS